MSFQKYPWNFFFPISIESIRENTPCFRCMYLPPHNWWVPQLMGPTNLWEGGSIHPKHGILPQSILSLFTLQLQPPPPPSLFLSLWFGDLLVVGRNAWVASSMGLEWWCWFEIIMIWFCSGGCVVLGLS